MPIIDDFKLKDWLPQEPTQGPPFPEWLKLFWPWYKPPVAEFRVSDLVISPPEVQIGQPVTISCAVENIGTAEGEYAVKLGGDFVGEQSVTLQPGESKVIAFEATPTEPKDYQVSVNGLTGTFKAIGVADIRVENLTISPEEVMVGQKVTISVLAKNYGSIAGSRKIVCTVS